MIREAPIEHDGRRYVVIFEDYKLAGFARGAKVKTRTIFSLREVVGEDLLAVAVGEHDPRFGCCKVDAWVAIPRAVLAKCNEAQGSAEVQARLSGHVLPRWREAVQEVRKGLAHVQGKRTARAK